MTSYIFWINWAQLLRLVKEAMGSVIECFFKVDYHIVSPVKYRKALIDEQEAEIIKETASGIAERNAIEVEAIGCDKDHIHFLCGAHPKIAPGPNHLVPAAHPVGQR